MIFALSRSLWLSLLTLAILGAADMASMYIRQLLIALTVPDAMRGRVGAVYNLFVGASNELGEFESGAVARVLGPVVATLVGGAGAVMIAALWAWRFPDLRSAEFKQGE